jgi:hypothetical protein
MDEFNYQGAQIKGNKNIGLPKHSNRAFASPDCEQHMGGRQQKINMVE